MTYIAFYLMVGVLLLIMKSPLKSLADEETRRIEIQNSLAATKVSKFRLTIFRLMLSFMLVSVWPIMLFHLRYKEKRDSEETSKIPLKYCHVYSYSDIQNDKIIKEIEERHSFYSSNSEPSPYAFKYEDWCRILNNMQEGDKLYDQKYRRAIRLERKGKIVDHISPTVICGIPSHNPRTKRRRGKLKPFSD